VSTTACHPYADPAHVAALGYESLDVPEWRTPILIRPLPGAPGVDGLGGYPLAAIDPSADLPGGLDRLVKVGLVSVVLVPDPLFSPPPPLLSSHFEVCRRFKSHFVLDRSRPIPPLPTGHRRNLVRARRAFEFLVMPLGEILDSWLDIYSQLVVRSAITGIATFSAAYFASLASMPALTTLVARREGRVVAATLWLRAGSTVYYHLGASSAEAYAEGASFGLFAMAIEHFATARQLHYGGGAGITGSLGGLARFKRGFANHTVDALLCGARLDTDRYARLAAGRAEGAFFPAYRSPGSADDMKDPT
jgi:hypothetical protein